MTLKCYKRTWFFTPVVGIRRNTCDCSTRECGTSEPRTTGYTLYLWRFVIHIGFGKPKKCDAPF